MSKNKNWKERFFSKNNLITAGLVTGGLVLIGGAVIGSAVMLSKKPQVEKKLTISEQSESFKKEIDLKNNQVFEKLLKLQEEKFKPAALKFENSEEKQVDKKLVDFKTNYESFLTSVEEFYLQKYSTNEDYKRTMKEFIKSQKETIKSLFDVIESDEIKTLLNLTKKDYIINNNQKIFESKDLSLLEFVLNDKVLGFELGEIQSKASEIIEKWSQDSSKSEEIKKVSKVFGDYGDVKQLDLLVSTLNEILKSNNESEIVLSEKALSIIKIQKLYEKIKNFKGKTFAEKDKEKFINDKTEIETLFKDVNKFLDELDFNGVQETFYDDFIERMETTNEEFNDIKNEFETSKNNDDYDFGPIWTQFSNGFYELIKNTYNPTSLEE